MRINIQKDQISYNATTKTFSVSGKRVKFGTKYTLVNDLTGNTMDFYLSHSTGSEWEPETKWVYHSGKGYILEVGNDDVTPQTVTEYLRGKNINND